ncbi:zeta toxin family protein [Vibrio rotiferianus]|uniref:zeta toxin family protein n=1 Tax=Vibrio rotiferianus TaxID=190895 RepID=UPI00406AAA50
MKDYSRPLNNNLKVHDFLTRSLGMQNTRKLGDHIQDVVTAEKLIESTTAESTLDHKVNRHPYYSTNDERKKLRKKIFKELITKGVLLDDDKIRLGRGGVRPAKHQVQKKAYIVSGLPGSGKSYVASKISNYCCAAIIDTDFAKRKFPEFKLPQGSTIVHEEAAKVMFEVGGDEPSVFEAMTIYGANIVIPKIGYDVKSIIDLQKYLIEQAGYTEVHLITVSIERDLATRRVLDRFLKTGRYVPLGVVFDVFANEPTLTYYRLKNAHSWSSISKLIWDDDSECLQWFEPPCNNNPIATLF